MRNNHTTNRYDRRMVTRLVIAKLIPVALKTVKNTFRKRKTARVQTKGQNDNQAKASNNETIETGDVTETPTLDVTNKNIS